MTERLPIGAVLALGVTQIVGYGTLYYSFGTLAPDVAKDFGISAEWVFGALSVALLVGGLVSPWIGRWIDSFGAGRVMTVGSTLAALALAAGAISPNEETFVVALVAMQIAANSVQYGAAFALLVQLSPNVAQKSITYLTLIAGFASTIFWPITSALHVALTWREVYLVFAAMNAVACIPIHFGLARVSSSTKGKAAKSAPKIVEGSLPPETRRLGFVLMVLGFSLLSLISSAILVHMVPLLSGLGLGTLAALIGTLFGPSQVASRLINMFLGRDLHPLTLTMIAAALITVALLVLATTAPSTSGALIFAALFGFGNGLFSIVAGTLPLSLFGSDGYGRLQGKIMSARLIVAATAPFAFAIAMGSIGDTGSLFVTAGLGIAVILSFLRISCRFR